MHNFSKITLLIVDDEPEICDLLKDDFEKLGAKVFTASDGVSAFKIATENSIDAVISDIRMPGGSGIMLLDELKKRRKDIPVVLFISGHSEITLEDSYNKGAEALFTKPFDRKELVRSVAQSLFGQEKKWSIKKVEWENIESRIELGFDSYLSAVNQQEFVIGRGGFALKINGKQHFEVKRNQIIDFKIKFQNSDMNNLVGVGIMRWFNNTDELFVVGVELLFLEEPGRAEFIQLINKHDPICFIPKLPL